MLDTDIASYAVKGASDHLRNRLTMVEPSLICVSAVTCAELLCGLKRVPANHRVHIGVRQFLKTVRVLAWDAEAAGLYAEVRNELVTSGQPIGELDMMIAAHSMAVAAVLVTNNVRHYERICAPLVLENWA